MSKKQKSRLPRVAVALWLHFTRAERVSLAIFVALSFLLACANYLSERLFAPAIAEPAIAAESNFRALLAAKRQPNIAVSELFVFDPNTASYDDLLILGLSARTARSIENYRNKGGKFRRPEDFQRIYTLSEEDYVRLRPFIRIGAQQRDYPGKSAFFHEKKGAKSGASSTSNLTLIPPRRLISRALACPIGWAPASKNTAKKEASSANRRILPKSTE